jgi:hypothetical protein
MRVTRASRQFSKNLKWLPTKCITNATTETQGLSQIGAANFIRIIEIRYRSSDAEQAVESSCRQTQVVHRVPQESLAFRSHRDGLPEREGRERRERRVPGRPSRSG